MSVKIVYHPLAVDVTLTFVRGPVNFKPYFDGRLHDNLADVLLTSLQSFQNSAQREHKDQCYARREQHKESLKTLVGYLDHGVLETLARIRLVTADSALTDTEKAALDRSAAGVQELIDVLKQKAGI